MRLEIRLLGDTRIAWLPGDGVVQLGRQGEMLLAYLILYRQSAHRLNFSPICRGRKATTPARG